MSTTPLASRSGAKKWATIDCPSLATISWRDGSFTISPLRGALRVSRGIRLTSPTGTSVRCSQDQAWRANGGASLLIQELYAPKTTVASTNETASRRIRGRLSCRDTLQTSPPSSVRRTVSAYPTAIAVFGSRTATPCSVLPWGTGFCHDQRLSADTLLGWRVRTPRTNK